MLIEHIDLESILTKVVPLAKLAASKIIDIYQDGNNFDITVKEDNSPVTIADKISHEIICSGLNTITPDIPVLSEEGHIATFSERKTWQYYWLIDPLDGTKEFINRSDEFTVNIALIQDNSPVLGVVMAPVKQVCYWAISGVNAYCQAGENQPQKIKVAEISDVVRIAVSRRHGSEEKLKQFLLQLGKPYELILCGSTLKICMIANGLADIYPRFGQTSEWDTAAGQCILEEAGGAILDYNSHAPLRYNTKPSLLNSEFIALNSGLINY